MRAPLSYLLWFRILSPPSEPHGVAGQGMPNQSQVTGWHREFSRYRHYCTERGYTVRQNASPSHRRLSLVLYLHLLAPVLVLASVPTSKLSV
jgi:hypothetical protein